MSYLDEIGLGQLWQRVDDVFARLTEAAHSMSFSDGVLTLFSCTDEELDSENLDSHFANHDEAVRNLGVSNGRLYAYDCNGNQNGNSINLKSASGVSDINYAWSLGIDGKKLYLKDKDGNEISGSSITLP